VGRGFSTNEPVQQLHPTNPLQNKLLLSLSSRGALFEVPSGTFVLDPTTGKMKNIDVRRLERVLAEETSPSSTNPLEF
jgi:hypothetical protein